MLRPYLPWRECRDMRAGTPQAWRAHPDAGHSSRSWPAVRPSPARGGRRPLGPDALAVRVGRRLPLPAGRADVLGVVPRRRAAGTTSSEHVRGPVEVAAALVVASRGPWILAPGEASDLGHRDTGVKQLGDRGRSHDLGGQLGRPAERKHWQPGPDSRRGARARRQSVRRQTAGSPRGRVVRPSGATAARGARSHSQDRQCGVNQRPHWQPQAIRRVRTNADTPIVSASAAAIIRSASARDGPGSGGVIRQPGSSVRGADASGETATSAANPSGASCDGGRRPHNRSRVGINPA